MTTIRILPEILSNQIAAGEVVERPSSVVKELIENSIDAQATRITVEVEKGGKSLIRVSDNGIGLTRDDALLAMERYATSKIFEAPDLFNISTMGFRGEALPSIASVSKLTMVTRVAGSNTAAQIDIEGGKIKNVSDTGAPEGTMIEVRRLFFNTPARRKFLKTDQTEVSHIADAVCGLALGNPHIHFRLVVDRKTSRLFSLTDDLFQRAVHVMGKDTAHKLYPMDHEEQYIQVRGYTAHPLITRSSSSRIFLFVNKRLVYDRGLVAAIIRGYKGMIMKGRFPLVVLFLDLPFEIVDVNVHPSKREVRFHEASKIYQAATLAVQNALSRAHEDPFQYSQPIEKTSDKTSEKISVTPSRDEPLESSTDPAAGKFAGQHMPSVPKTEEMQLPWSPPVAPVRQTDAGFGRLPKKAPKPQPDVRKYSGTQENTEDRQWQKDDNSSLKSTERQQNAEVHQNLQRTHDANMPSRSNDRAPLDTRSLVSDMRIIGQVLNTYILVESSDGLLLIDQHAAHERIVYERLQKKIFSRTVPAQDLVVPETIELGHREADVLTGIIDALADAGIHIEPFGGTTFVIKAVPAIIDEKQSVPIICDIVEKNMDQHIDVDSREWLEEVLMSMACHHAIRASKHLHVREMEDLIAELWTCENFMHCPHGRPIIVTLRRTDLEKLFKRVV